MTATARRSKLWVTKQNINSPFSSLHVLVFIEDVNTRRIAMMMMMFLLPSPSWFIFFQIFGGGDLSPPPPLRSCIPLVIFYDKRAKRHFLINRLSCLLFFKVNMADKTTTSPTSEIKGDNQNYYQFML